MNSFKWTFGQANQIGSLPHKSGRERDYNTHAHTHTHTHICQSIDSGFRTGLFKSTHSGSLPLHTAMDVYLCDIQWGFAWVQALTPLHGCNTVFPRYQRKHFNSFGTVFTVSNAHIWHTYDTHMTHIWELCRLPCRLNLTVLKHDADDMYVSSQGDCEDHATLLCSLLLGFGLDAYVCVGTKAKNTPHVWVMTCGTDGSVTFWESLTANR